MICLNIYRETDIVEYITPMIRLRSYMLFYY